MQTIAYALMSCLIAKATIADAVLMVSVTASTVSHVLKDHPAITASTKNRVSCGAKKLNCRFNRLASSLRLGKIHIIDVIIPSAEINFLMKDLTALGAFQAIKAVGKKMPDDLALTGFANEAFGSSITPSLFTVDQQTIKMAEEAAKLFFKLSINNRFYTNELKKSCWSQS